LRIPCALPHHAGDIAHKGGIGIGGAADRALGLLISQLIAEAADAIALDIAPVGAEQPSPHIVLIVLRLHIANALALELPELIVAVLGL